jgi:NAD(P)-dependent dehydrogenase (short-subunit alcohol dehydrogenase family)
MLMSVVEGASPTTYPELAGKRVLVTGVTSGCGVDIVRAFAEHRARLVLQFDEESETAQVIAELAAPSALDIKVLGPVAAEVEPVMQLARHVVQAYGGLDVVVNLVPLSPGQIDASVTTTGIERMMAERLLLPYMLSKIAANRMAMLLTDGLVLNVAMLTGPARGRAQAFASVIKTAMTAITRAQAEEWASKAIRFNAIAPPTAQVPATPSLAGEGQVAALALYLASGRGKAFSGQVFEAESAR